MTLPPPTNGEMEKRLEELSRYDCAYYGLDGKRYHLAPILSYIRTLEAEHREMREALEEIASHARADFHKTATEEGIEMWKCAQKVLSSLQNP